MKISANPFCTHRGRVVLLALLVLSMCLSLASAAREPDSKMWRDIDGASLPQGAKRLIAPARFRAVRLDTASMMQSLSTAPTEFTSEAKENPGVIYLPLPDGTMARFRF